MSRVELQSSALEHTAAANGVQNNLEPKPALGIVSTPPPLPSRPPTAQPIKHTEPKPSLRERFDSFVKKHVAAPQKRPRKR